MTKEEWKQAEEALTHFFHPVELKVDSTPQQPFIWLDFRACNKLIEVLKGYVNNAKRGGGHG